MASVVDISDVQAGTITGYRLGHSRFLLLHADSAATLQRTLGQLLAWVVSEKRWRAQAIECPVNASLTYAGFHRIGLPADVLAKFPDAFRSSPADRATRLGDVGENAPTAWPESLSDNDAHLLVTLSSSDDNVGLLDERAGLLTAAAAGITVLHERSADRLPASIEHFGFADGGSQPDVAGVPFDSQSPARAGSGVPLADGSWRAIAPGEFVLGYPDEDGQVIVTPAPWLAMSGSYQVYRELEQNVPLFRSTLEALAQQTGMNKELIAAKIVGRWRDGVPLTTVPVREDVADLTEHALDQPPNNFRYSPDDAAGYRCPLGAHIRRMNPRDALDPAGEFTRRHRMIRRGMPYGPWLPEGTENDKNERGLVFVCFVADLARQFEMVQRAWANDGDTFGLADDRDYLIGAPGGSLTMTVQSRTRPQFLAHPRQLVTSGVTQYCFAPGLKAMELLAAGEWN